MNKKLSLVFSVLFIYLSVWLIAQEKKDSPKSTFKVVPTVEVKDIKPKESPIYISDIKVEVEVVGNIAVTTLDYIIHNPNNRILEGEFQFPLSEGQTISRFALDINGKLREGVTVNKNKGQEAFEAVIRQNIDPGLLEKTEGNNFKARVYPLPAKGDRRVVIAYEQELQKDEKGEFRYILPMEYAEALKTLEINLTVFGEQSIPKIEQSQWGSFQFNKLGNAYVAHFKKENYKPQGSIVFSVPQKLQQSVFIEKGKITDLTYFYATVDPDYKAKEKTLPKTISLYWDVSSSSDGRNIKLEMELLNSYFQKIKNAIVYLKTFNIGQGKEEIFTIKEGNWQKLKTYLESLSYDGATQYRMLNFGKDKGDEILLFTDGLNSFGASEIKLGNKPVYTINSQLKSDNSYLNYIASVSGGKYINLTNQTTKEALEQLMTESYRLISIDYDSNQISDLAYSDTQTLMSGVTFSITGVLKFPTAILTLNFGLGNKVYASKTLQLNQKEIQDNGGLIEKIWAEKKIAQLDTRYETNKKEIESIGKKFNIVTRNTSLIVLDRVEDYVRYRIVPPLELLEEYNRQISNQGKEKQSKINEKVNHTIQLFNDRKNWWKAEYPKLAPKHSKDMKIKGEDSYRRREMNSEVAMSLAPEERIREESGFLNMAAGMYISEEVDMDKKIVSEKKSAKNTIKLEAWNPSEPYMEELGKQKDTDIYATYLKIKETYKNTPSFYLDVAYLLESKGRKQEALIVLSNLAEMQIKDYRLLRVLANRLRQLGYYDYAINTFEEVLKLRSEEPQSYRDLALTYADNKQYQEAVDLMYRIIENKRINPESGEDEIISWDGRFPQIELIAAEEMNVVIVKAKQNNAKLNLDNINKQLIYEMPLDIRIVLNWDTDNSDMDLWVTDPYGEKCYYGNKNTRIGGHISADFTGGYGPEEFVIKEAVKGKYKIEANYYGSRQQTITGPTTIYLDVYTRYASGEEKKETITLRLTENREIINIGEIEFK